MSCDILVLIISILAMYSRLNGWILSFWTTDSISRRNTFQCKMCIVISIHQPIYVSIYPSVYPSIYLFIHPTNNPSLYVYPCPSIHTRHISIHLSIYLFLKQCIYLLIHPLIHLPIQLTDKRSEIYHSSHHHIKLFPGEGQKLMNPISHKAHPSPDQYHFPHPHKSKHHHSHKHSVTVDQFLSRIPKHVIRGVHVIDVHTGITETLQVNRIFITMVTVK